MNESNRYQESRPLYFMHIHKTAGASLTLLLDRFYAPSEVCTAHQWHQFFAIPRADMTRFRLFRGHFHYCLHTVLPSKPNYITFLRDPVDRVLSRYQHLRRDKPHYLYSRASQMTLTEFLHDPLTRAQVQNLQMRTIAYDFDIDGIAHSIGKPLTSHLEMEERINKSISALTETDDRHLLPIAKQRLSQFAFVGFTECFQHSLDQLIFLFGWPQAEMVRINSSPEPLSRESLSSKTLEEIAALNWADIELYHYARDIFGGLFSA